MKHLFLTLLLSVILPTAATAENATESNKLYITANGTTMTATLVENSSTAALKELLADAPLTISMSDYGNFEKVGPIGATLPRNDEHITTQAGDLILYLGTSFVIYYAPNTYSFTRLGKIDGNPTKDYLLSVLGKGNVNVTLSLSDSGSTGIDKVKSDMNKLNVFVSRQTIEILGADTDAEACVFNVNGQLIYSGVKRTIELPEAGVYVVSCNNAKAKVLIK